MSVCSAYFAPWSAHAFGRPSAQAIDALDPSEQLTEMGLHLLDLPIDPQLGKMVLYSVVLKCLDPVLTIVCCLSVKDPCESGPCSSVSGRESPTRRFFVHCVTLGMTSLLLIEAECFYGLVQSIGKSRDKNPRTQALDDHVVGATMGHMVTFCDISIT